MARYTHCCHLGCVSGTSVRKDVGPYISERHLSRRVWRGWPTKCFNQSSKAGADPGFLKGGGGVQIRSTSKKGGPDGGPILGPMLKSLHRGTKGGGGS